MTDTSEQPDRPVDRTRTWLRLAAGSALLTGLAFVQSPGYLIADTKFDLAVNPVAFLARAIHLWDAEGAFGQLQNQAYGYLWPMGPFFALGHLAGVPGWAVQRLWLALVLVVAFVGVARLARMLGVRSDLACMIAGFAYATSPRLLSTLGPISIEAWPSAVAPWVLLSLVVGSERGSPRRAAALGGLAVGMVGGVNAAATFAVIPLGVVWLLSRSPGPRRRSLMVWWPTFTLLFTLWWLVPLFVMGAYSPPFLDYIETSSITTFPTTVVDALRGTSHWVPYIDPSWQGGNDTVTLGYLALNSAVVLMLGVLGITVGPPSLRPFLASAVAVGLVLVGLGHGGSVHGWLAGDLRGLLDGPLAPLRNVHKLDPVVRVPLVLGLALAVDAARHLGEGSDAAAGRPRAAAWLSPRVVYPAMAVLAVAGAAVPLLSGRVAPTDPVLETPPYWRQADSWLSSHTAPGTTALLAPGSGFADYLWGVPRDEPAQYLADTTWAVRNAIPLAPPGNIRMLDRIERDLAQGTGSRALVSVLRRAGISHLVVRNDLQVGDDVPDGALVHQSLASSPGLERVAAFGPDVGGSTVLSSDEGRLLVEGGAHGAWRAIEVFEVPGAAPAVAAETLPVLVGGSEDVYDVTATSLLGDTPVELAVDHGAAPPDGPIVLTDGLLDRERFFGRVHDAYSAVVTPGDRRRTGNPTSDYLPPDADRWLTTARLEGVAELSASSSRSDAAATSGSRPGELPYAAVDGTGESQWVSDPGVAGVAWWRAELENAVPVDAVRVVQGDIGADRVRLRARTAQGVGPAVQSGHGLLRELPVPPGPTTWIQVETVGSAVGSLSLADIDWGGPEVRRTLVTPELPEGWATPDAIVLRSLLDARTGCLVVSGRTPCGQDRVVAAEEPLGLDRDVRLPAETTYAARARAVPRGGSDLATLVQRDLPLNATGSSTAVPDPRASGLAAIDGDAGTAWVPRLDDDDPTLAVNWLGEQELRGLQLVVPDTAPVRTPTRVGLAWPGGSRELDVPDNGIVSFPPITTDRITLTLLGGGNAASVSSTGGVTALPVGLAELTLIGVPYDPLVLPDAVRTLECGTGPDVEVGGTSLRTALRSSPARLYRMRSAPLRFCGGDGDVASGGGRTAPVTLGGVAGSRVRAPSSPLATMKKLVLERDLPSMSAVPVDVTLDGPVRREADAPAGTLVLRQNHNAGWAASAGGSRLTPAIVDGWQQAWRIDEAGPVTVTFAPDRWYRLGLGLGGLALLLGLLVVLLDRSGSGRRQPPLDARAMSLLVAAALVVGVGGLRAGWLGVALVGAGAVLARLARVRLRDRDELVPEGWLAALLVFVAVSASYVRPWGSDGGWAGALAWPHYLVLASVGLLLGCAVGARRRVTSDIAGRSTTR